MIMTTQLIEIEISDSEDESIEIDINPPIHIENTTQPNIPPNIENSNNIQSQKITNKNIPPSKITPSNKNYVYDEFEDSFDDDYSDLGEEVISIVIPNNNHMTSSELVNSITHDNTYNNDTTESNNIQDDNLIQHITPEKQPIFDVNNENDNNTSNNMNNTSNNMNNTSNNMTPNLSNEEHNIPPNLSNEEQSEPEDEYEQSFDNFSDEDVQLHEIRKNNEKVVISNTSKSMTILNKNDINLQSKPTCPCCVAHLAHQKQMMNQREISCQTEANSSLISTRDNFIKESSHFETSLFPPFQEIDLNFLESLKQISYNLEVSKQLSFTLSLLSKSRPKTSKKTVKPPIILNMNDALKIVDKN